MSEYFITKRDACPNGDDGWEHSHCCNGKGYIDTPVQVEPVEIHCGVVFVAKTDALGNPIDADVRKVIEEGE